MAHIYIGIDCHKRTHTAAIINCFNEKLDSVTFENNNEGFNSLVKKVKKHTTKDITPIFGLEDVNHLGHTLSMFLNNKGYHVKSVNSTYTNSERKNNPIISKTDDIDALCLAKITLDKLDTLPRARNDDLYWTLKQLVAMRNSVIDSNINYKNKLHAQLLHHYPNYDKFFYNFDCKTALSFWEQFPDPTKLENITDERLGLILFDNSNGFFNIAKAIAILELVKEYDYNTLDFQEERNFLIRSLIKQIRYNDGQIDNLDLEINELMKRIDCKLDTFIGIDKVAAAKIVSEIGNIERFSSSDKLAKYAGIAPVSFSSGGKEKNVNCKFGNRQLNSLIFTLAWVNINCGRNKNNPYNPIFYEYFMKKVKEGKTRHQAINSVMRRIINIIYGMLKNNTAYVHPKQLSDNCLDIFNAEYEKLKNKEVKSCNK